jgi:hypothetical protein
MRATVLLLAMCLFGLVVLSAAANTGRCSCLCGSDFQSVGSFAVSACTDAACSQQLCTSKYPKPCSNRAQVGARCDTVTVTSSSSATTKPSPQALQPLPKPKASAPPAAAPTPSTTKAPQSATPGSKAASSTLTSVWFNTYDDSACTRASSSKAPTGYTAVSGTCYSTGSSSQSPTRSYAGACHVSDTDSPPLLPILIP